MSRKKSGPLPIDAVVNGDCVELMRSWPARCVDLIFADPPYNIGYAYDAYDDRREYDDYVRWTQRWIGEAARLLKPSGSLYVLIGDEYAAEVRLWLRRLEQRGKLVFRSWIVWHYTFGQNCKLKFNRSHAHLFYCVGSAAKGESNWTVQPPFTFNREAIAVPSARLTTYADRRANPSGKLPDDTWYLRPQETGGEYFQPGCDTWYQPRLCGTFNERVEWHPCQLPEALLERVIKVSSNEGDVVFDPFVGSGTTLVVAKRLGRRWLGCELSRDYAVKAMRRIEAVKVGQCAGPNPHGSGGRGKKSTTGEDEPLESCLFGAAK